MLRIKIAAVYGLIGLKLNYYILNLILNLFIDMNEDKLY
jgi:hypothetical protein